MISKYQGGETLADYRIARRNKRKAAKMTIQKELRARDGIGCRWPGCEFWRKGYRVEAAHLDASGMGGDPSLIRTQRQKLIRICYPHHQGVCSLHSGDLRIVPVFEARGTDGPCSFERRDPKAKDGWAVEGVEDEFTFSTRANPAALDEDGDDE